MREKANGSVRPVSKRMSQLPLLQHTTIAV